jgi:tRNA-dependent cyclodipeptide synthase
MDIKFLRKQQGTDREEGCSDWESLRTASEIYDARALIARIRSFLSEKKLKYQVTRFSPSQDEGEIERDVSKLSVGLLEGVPVEVEGQGNILAVIPTALGLRLDDLTTLFAPRQVRFLTPGEIGERFSIEHSTDVVPPLGDLFGLQSFLSPLIEQVQTVGFFVDSEKTLITLDAAEFRRSIANASASQIPTRAKYRVIPTEGRKTFKRCILGVSLEKANFYAAKLIPMTDWIRRHYEDCDVMLGDSLHRITLQLNSSMHEDEAIARSKWLANDFVYSNLPIFNPAESSCRFNFVFCSEIQKWPEYHAYYDQLRRLFGANEALRKSVEDFASIYLGRTPDRKHSGNAVDLSSTYLLEELAVICCLAQTSPCAFVYPGSLTILQEIAEGKHPYLPSGLRHIDYVALQLKRRNWFHGREGAAGRAIAG